MGNYNQVSKESERARGSQKELLAGLERAPQCLLRLAQGVIKATQVLARAQSLKTEKQGRNNLNPFYLGNLSRQTSLSQ
jgi:hypothetical protein